MKRILSLIVAVALMAAPAFGIGANPRYIEELAWGGGYGATGGWLEADGDLWMNGDITGPEYVRARYFSGRGAEEAFYVSSEYNALIVLDSDNDSTASFIVADYTTATKFSVNEAGNVTGLGVLTMGSGAVALTNATGNLLSAAFADAANIGMLNEAETIAGNWGNTANPWADNEVSDTLTASLFVGSGSSTTAVDLATAEVAGTLPTANVATYGAFTTTGAATISTTSGSLTVGGNAVSGPLLQINGAAGSNRSLKFLSGGVERFRFYINNTVEGGANAGSDWGLATYDDGGNFTDLAIGVTRAAGGAITLARPVTVSGSNSLTVNGDIAVLGGDITSTAPTMNVFSSGSTTTANLLDDATSITMGALTGTTTIQNAAVSITGDLTVAGGDITSLAFKSAAASAAYLQADTDASVVIDADASGTNALFKVVTNGILGTEILKVDETGNLKLPLVGGGLYLKEGTNATMGTVTLAGGTATATTTKASATMRVILSRQATGGTTGDLSVGTITPGTSFVINANDGADTSTILWIIVEPA